MKKIKTISAYTYDAQDASDEGFMSSFTELDEKGNVIMTASYISENELETKSEIRFDDAGNKTEELSYISEDEVGEHIFYKRNSAGNIIAEEIQYFDGSISYRTYIHDNIENTLSIIMKDEEDAIEEKEFIRYDQNGNVIERITIDENEKIKEKHVNEFNEKNLIINRKETDNTGNLTAERKYTYDEDGNMTQRLTINRKGNLMELVTHKYDERGRMIENYAKNLYLIKYIYNTEEKTITEERYLPNGMIESTSVSKFDEDNLLIEEDNMVRKIVYKYEFFE
jgi:hypothetical protein